MTPDEKRQITSAKRNRYSILRAFNAGESVDDVAHYWGVPIVIVEDIIRRWIERHKL